jgi:hypothetical protein
MRLAVRPCCAGPPIHASKRSRQSALAHLAAAFRALDAAVEQLDPQRGHEGLPVSQARPRRGCRNGLTSDGLTGSK